MKLLFLYGMPATGKLTVARIVAKQTGYKLFHNHLVVDMLLSTFEFGSKPFRMLREEMWLSVMREACAAGVEGMIFTFAPEPTVSPDFAEQVARLVETQGGEVFFVRLTCASDTLLSRLGNPSRAVGGKLTSAALFKELQSSGAFEDAHMPAPSLAIATDNVSPEEAAQQIISLLPSSAGAELNTGKVLS